MHRNGTHQEYNTPRAAGPYAGPYRYFCYISGKGEEKDKERRERHITKRTCLPEITSSLAFSFFVSRNSATSCDSSSSSISCRVIFANAFFISLVREGRRGEQKEEEKKKKRKGVCVSRHVCICGCPSSGLWNASRPGHVDQRVRILHATPSRRYRWRFNATVLYLSCAPSKLPRLRRSGTQWHGVWCSESGLWITYRSVLGAMPAMLLMVCCPD